MKHIPESGVVGKVALKEAATTELCQVMRLVKAAVQDKVGMGMYVEVEAMFPTRVIVCQNGRYFAYPYTIDQDNKVVLGDPAEVVEEFVPVKMTESAPADAGAAVFLEADASGAVWDVVLIRAGLSMNRVFYPDAVLREAAPRFEGARVLARSDEEHAQGKGKDVRNVVGWISGVKFAEGAAPDAGRLTGKLNLAAGAKALRENLADAWQRGKRDLAGLSIDADGTAKVEMREAQRVRVAKSITRVNSVDLVVDPGAGGALVRLVEAAVHEESDPMKQRMLDTIKAKAPAIFAKIDPATITDEALEAHYAEAVATPAAPAPGPATGLTQEQVNEQIRMVEARASMRTAIAGSRLPQAAQDKLLADFGARTTFTEADVTKAIKDERQYLARFTESGKVTVGGDGDIVVEDRSVKIAGMLDAFFDPSHKDHRSVQSFKECYIEITGDRKVTGRVSDADRTRLAESMGERFVESMDSTTFAYVLGDSIARRMVADYNLPSVYNAWQPLVNVVPVSDFRIQRRTRFGGYGDLPTVAQGAPYASLTSPTDEEATYAIAKKGGTEDVTLEMVKNDDVGAIRMIPTKLSRAAQRTLGKFVFDFIRTNPTLYDGVAFFHATHGNLGANALDATYLAAARLRMLKQTEAGSSDRLGIGPKFLIVPVDLQETAVNLFNRNTNLDKTFIQATTLQIIPVWYWTDTNDWAIGADPMDIPSIEVGFLDGNQTPEMFVQDMPNVGSMFSNDKLTMKLRHIYGGNVVNYRGFDKSVV